MVWFVGVVGYCSRDRWWWLGYTNSIITRRPTIAAARCRLPRVISFFGSRSRSTCERLVFSNAAILFLEIFCVFMASANCHATTSFTDGSDRAPRRRWPYLHHGSVLFYFVSLCGVESTTSTNSRGLREMRIAQRLARHTAHRASVTSIPALVAFTVK